jgi:mono/diheme cytochrome c family protein
MLNKMVNRNFTTKIALFALFLLLASVALLGSRGSFAVATVEAQRGGAAVYTQNCARCHGADGRAQTPKGRETDAIDLTSDDWSPDTARDTRIVTNGKKSMPSFRRKLTPAQISAVVQYIRRFKH